LDRGHCSTRILLIVFDSERLGSSSLVLACSDKTFMDLKFELIVLNLETIAT